MKEKINSILLALFVFMTLQSSQCVSPEYTVAKQAIEKNDWIKAKENLEKEVARNPKNGEAWYYLGVSKKKTSDIKGMIAAFNEARRVGVEEKLKTTMSVDEFSSWVEMFNAAISDFNSGAENADADKLSRSISSLQDAIKIKPDYPENYSLLGLVQLTKGDTAEALKAYEQYVTMQKPTLEYMKIKGLALGQTRDKAIENVGVVAEKTVGSKSSTDSLQTDVFKAIGDEIYLYSAMRDKAGFIVEGVRVNPPKTWSNQERERFASLNARPYSELASVYYNKRDYDNAMKSLDALTLLKPNDEQALNLKIQMYKDQGKMDEALSSLADLVRQDPKNKFNLANYGMVLMQMDKLDDAIAQYEKAIEIDPEFDVPLFNCAAALKNKAGVIQKEERDLREKNPKYKENTQRYFPLLTKAAEYFDRYRKLKNHLDDLTSMEQLANIYEVVQEKAKLKQVTAELESTEYTNQNNPKYWDILGGLYARANQADKADKAFKKADEARKKKQ